MADKQEDDSVSSLPPALQPLIAGIKKSYHTKEFADLTIKHEGSDQTWKVHKLVVCSQSDQLKTALETGAKLEGKTEKNDLTLDDDPQVIEAMLNYLYTSDYGDFGNSQVHVSQLVLDVRVFIAADKYFIKPLGDLAARKFSSLCETAWSTPEFAKAIKEIYTNGPEHDDRLKRTVMERVNEHAARFFHQDNKAEYAAFHEILGELAELGADIARELAPGSPARKYKCPTGQELFEVGVPHPNYFGCPKGHYTGQPTSWWSSYLVKQ